MRSVVAFMSVFLLLNVATVAQPIKFGLKAGINLANLKVRGDLQDHRNGFNAGLFTNFRLGCRFNFQPELVFSQQGANYSSAVQDRLNYINIPLLAQYRIGEKFKIHTGLQIGVLLSYERKVLDPRILVAEASFSKLDASWAFGGAYETRKGWGLDIRYNYGLNNISNLAMPSMPSRNRVWQIGVTYQLACNH